MCRPPARVFNGFVVFAHLPRAALDSVNRIKGRVRARGARGQHWYNDRRTELARKNSRTQALWYLHLAGDWSEAFETEASAIRPHMMRCMLVSNLALDQRFANGTQGRLLCWFPEKAESRKALQSSYPELFARFVKESSLRKPELLADIDSCWIVVIPRKRADHDRRPDCCVQNVPSKSGSHGHWREARDVDNDAWTACACPTSAYTSLCVDGSWG